VAITNPITDSMCHSGQMGKSCRGCTKYCGPTSVSRRTKTVDRVRERSQSGAET